MATDSTNFDLSTNIEFDKVSFIKDIRESTIEIDLMQSFKEIVVVESIFNKLLKGYILLIDRDKKFDNFLINGTEKLIISFRSMLSDVSYQYEFVASVPEKLDSENTSRDQLIKIDFQDPLYYNFIREYSTSFKDKLISEFVSQFSEQVLKLKIDNSRVEKTDTKMTLAFPYLKFHYILQYLNQFAQSERGNKLYLYYSDTIATYYRSLSYMLNQEPVGEYYETHNKEEYTNLQNFSMWQLEPTLDIQNIQLSRGFGSTMYHFDYDKKEQVETTFKYSQTIPNYKTDKKSLFVKNLDDEKSFHYFTSMENHKGDNFIIAQSLGHGINISLLVKGMIERRCGTTAQFNFMNILDPKFEYNEYLSGKYLIRTIEHHFFPGQYQQVLKIVKNSTNVIDSSTQV